MRCPTCTVANGVFAQCGQVPQADAIGNRPGGTYGDSVLGAPVRPRRRRRHVYGATTAAARSAATSAGRETWTSGRVRMK